jgi:hypothetical protein
MLFALPMVWREPKENSSDCYFCLTNITGITSKSKHSEIFRFPICNEACPSVQVPVPKPLENLTSRDDNCDSDEYHRWQEGDNVDCDLMLEASCFSFEPHLLMQRDCNDLVHDLNFTKQQAELLGSRL